MDIAIFNFIHGFAGQYRWLDYFAIFCASYLQYFLGVWILAHIFIGKGEERRKNQLMVFSAVIAAIISRGIITETIRFFYFNPRTFMALNFTPLVSDTASSFPSGHMTFFFAVAAAVYFYNKKLGWWLAGFSLLIGIARIYAGVHWPYDIIVGIVIGIASGWLVSWYKEKRWKK